MNGRITIKLEGVSTPLTFGMLAIEEFGKRQAIGGHGVNKMLIDLIYSGYCNEQILLGVNPELSYRDISEKLEDLILSNDPCLSDVFKCFEDSKAGSQLMGAIKKKIEPAAKPVKKKPTGSKSKNLPSES